MKAMSAHAMPKQVRRHSMLRVLVADDCPANRVAMGDWLGTLGYVPVLSEGGSQAFDQAAGGGFDLILLDIAMPETNGLDMLCELRGSPVCAEIPIIVVTDRSEPASVVEALKHGADDYLARPFAFEVLAARIERTIFQSRRIRDLKRFNAALDARIAARAVELGEAKSELAAMRSDRNRLICSIDALNQRIETMCV